MSFTFFENKSFKILRLSFCIDTEQISFDFIYTLKSVTKLWFVSSYLPCSVWPNCPQLPAGTTMETKETAGEICAMLSN